MKYMTFNSSCSYAGLANLLSFYGVETEDREIALRMRLPWLFAREDSRYLSGPMLQGAEWFDLYLKPLGFAFSERQLGREKVCAGLRDNAPAMLGLRVSPESKHAVIYTGWQDGKYRLLNNKRKDSPEPDTLELTEAELLARLDETVTVGRLERTAPVSVDYRPHLEKSLRTLEALFLEIKDFCMTGQNAVALRESMDRLFRAILLDGVTMLELLGEMETVTLLKAVRTQYLEAVHAGHSQRLENVLDMGKLNGSIVYYENLITERIKEDSI